MSDSKGSPDLPDTDERREARLEQVRHWAEYIRREEPEVWGPQLNRIVNAQLDAARDAGVTAEELAQVEAAASRLAESE
jgi:hypothetical protein